MSTGRKIRANGPVRIDRIAEKLLDPVVSKAGFSSTQILAAWPDIVGPDLSERSRPEKLRWPPRREGTDQEARAAATLVVRAEGGDAMELQYASGEIIARINAIFGWKAVEKLTIRQAPVETGPNTSKNAQFAPERPTTMDEKTAERLKTVEDESLRAALSRLGARVARDTKL
jgi:hypothetical protein